MNNDVQISILVRQFLQLATGLDALYSRPKSTPSETVVLTYQLNNGQAGTRAINNELLSERKMFVVTIQGKRAQDVQFYAGMIKQATIETAFLYMSESFGQDPYVMNGHIATIIMSYYNAFDSAAPKKIFSAEETRKLLQAFADRLIFNTSIYRDTLENSFIDRYIVPELTDATLEEILTLQENVYKTIMKKK